MKCSKSRFACAEQVTRSLRVKYKGHFRGNGRMVVLEKACVTYSYDCEAAFRGREPHAFLMCGIHVAEAHMSTTQ